MIPGVVFKTFRCTKSSIQNRTRTRTLIIYIYICIYIYIYVSNRIVHQSFSLYNFIQASKKLHGLPKAPAKQDSNTLEPDEKEANAVEDSTDAM